MKRTAPLMTSFLLIACSSSGPDIDIGGNPDAGGSAEPFSVVLDLLPEDVVDVDLLFVMDNSGSMAEEQASIAAWAEDALFGVLELDPDTMLNLHIGVVSTDLGAGPWSISSCEGGGDGGALNDTPADGTCTTPTDRWIVDIDDGAGGRTTNYSGTLQDTFSCIARLGTSGCGYEHPLEAMHQALTNPVNAGFLREDALLAVIIVSDEDDCSTFDTNLFDTSQTDITDPLGPLTSFRCFEFGVVCDPDNARTVGAKTACESRETSPYMTPVSDYIDFLESLKYDDGMIVVAGIFGDAETVAVETDDMGNPRLGAACSSAGGIAYPGVRLQQFLDGFPGRNRFASICDDDLSGPLADAAMAVRDTALRTPCLRGELRDMRTTDGLQPECRAFEQVTLTGGMIQRNEIRPCSDGVAGPCFDIVEDATACGHTETGLALSVSSAEAPTDGAHLVVECVTQ